MIIRGSRIVRAFFRVLLGSVTWTLPQNKRLTSPSSALPSDKVGNMTSEIPLVDIGSFLVPRNDAETDPLVSRQAREQTARNLYAAFSTWGFCLLKGHGIPSELRSALYQTAEDFFSLPLEKKVELHVKKGGVAWRGYMPRGEKLLTVIWIIRKESTLDRSILTIMLTRGVPWSVFLSPY